MNFGWKFLDDYEELGMGMGMGGGGGGKGKGGKREGNYIYISIQDKCTRFQNFFFSLLFTVKFAVYKQTV